MVCNHEKPNAPAITAQVVQKLQGLGVKIFTADPVLAKASGLIWQSEEQLYQMVTGFILIGGASAVANIYMRLIHQKYLNCFFAGKKILGELNEITLKDTEDKKSFAYIREQIDKNFGVAGLFMPWLFVALFTNTFDIMLCCYALYYLLSFLAVCVLYCKKATAFEKYAQNKMNKGKD